MPDPVCTRSDLCSICAAEAGRACRSSPQRAQRRRPPTSRRLPARTPGGIDHAIRLSTAAAVLAVTGIAAYVSYGHA